MHSTILMGTSCTVESSRYTTRREIEKVRGVCFVHMQMFLNLFLSAPNQMKTKERGGGSSHRSVCKPYL